MIWRNSCVTVSRSCSACGKDGIGMTTKADDLIPRCVPKHDVKKRSTFAATRCTQESTREVCLRETVKSTSSRQDGLRLTRDNQGSPTCARGGSRRNFLTHARPEVCASTPIQHYLMQHGSVSGVITVCEDFTCGAGVGLSSYMTNSIGSAIYFTGTVEAWGVAFPHAQPLETDTFNFVRMTGYLILAFAVMVVSLGFKFVTRVRLTILCMLLRCLIGTDEGVDTGPGYDEEELAFANDTTEYSSIASMALWFPACTGIMAGSNRSAHLKDPARTIPTGRLLAQRATSICYLSFVLLYGAVAPRATLLNDKFFAACSAF